MSKPRIDDLLENVRRGGKQFDHLVREEAGMVSIDARDGVVQIPAFLWREIEKMTGVTVEPGGLQRVVFDVTREDLLKLPKNTENAPELRRRPQGDNRG